MDLPVLQVAASQRLLAHPSACAEHEGPTAAPEDLQEDDGRSIVLALQDESESQAPPPPAASVLP